MKISPLAAGGSPQHQGSPDGRTADPAKMERAKAIATGQTPDEPKSSGDAQVDRILDNRLRIKMKTNRNTTQYVPPAETPEVPAQLKDAPTDPDAQRDILATSEQADATSEETKPLSPQFAALARQKRALQLKEQEILAKEKALTTQSGDTKSLEEYRARIKANALSVLLEEGVSYDQLTEQILAQGQEQGPAYTKLEAEIKALKEGLENQTKSQVERDAESEKRVLADMRKQADQLIAQGDDYEMVREAGYAPKVIELIHRNFKESGEIMDVTEALNLIENELLEESLKFARIKKVQSRLTPAQVQTQQALKQERPGTKTMKTLTNRDGSSSLSMSKRERAIAAMEGRLK